MPPADPLVATDRWLREVVVGQRFCPFAVRPYADDEVYLERAGGDAAAVLSRLARRAGQMTEHDSPATALLVVTGPAFASLACYLALAAAAEELLAELAGGGLSLATFHPEHRFAGLPADDPAHELQRAPWPLLHLLRADQVRALAGDPGVATSIQAVNRLRAAELGPEFFARYRRR